MPVQMVLMWRPPLSLTEWFMNFHKQACKGAFPAIETTVRAGELLFVPRGWWHMAMNIEVPAVYYLSWEPPLRPWVQAHLARAVAV